MVTLLLFLFCQIRRKRSSLWWKRQQQNNAWGPVCLQSSQSTFKITKSNDNNNNNNNNIKVNTYNEGERCSCIYMRVCVATTTIWMRTNGVWLKWTIVGIYIRMWRVALPFALTNKCVRMCACSGTHTHTHSLRIRNDRDDSKQQSHIYYNSWRTNDGQRSRLNIRQCATNAFESE